MFPIFLAQLPTTPATPEAQPQEIVVEQQIRALPGSLNNIPVFNSNSPELVTQEGILLSTFAGEGKTNSSAHLNYPLQGYFDIFAHHVAKAPTPENLRTLYLGIILHNPSNKPITVNILQAASYLSQPDAPFIQLPTVSNNDRGKVYAGPGSRAMSDILRNRRQEIFPAKLVIPANTSEMLVNLPIPVRGLEPPLNGRSTYMRLYSDGAIYAASLALFSPLDDTGKERAPTLLEWEKLLQSGNLSTPRDRTPTIPNAPGSIIYGRVAGISLGSQWKTDLVDNTNTRFLTIPTQGKAFSYGLSTLDGGTLGTGQIQTAPMAVRYADTAYKAHGNYGVEYSLTLPLFNPTTEAQTVTLAIETPIKQDKLNGGLRFFAPLPKPVFFRGTVKISYTDDRNLPRTEYFHLVQKRGQKGEALVTLKMPPQNRRLVKVEFLYPPDATPPQVLTIRTLPNL